MDSHLEVRLSRPAGRSRAHVLDCAQKLAAKHTDVLFLKADVANVPFLVTKLEVKVLPCLIGFVDGVTKMKCVCRLALPLSGAFTR